jgi:MFS family permease
LACWLASGIVFGFAALKPVLIAEGVYRELCPVDGDFEDPEWADDPAVPCAEQDLRLNLFFIVASITCNVSSLFAGAALDRYGRRFCWLFACFFLAAGSALLGSSFAIDEFDGYLLGNFFLALGGTFIFVPSYQLANAFPKHSGLIVALITGSFDASAAVFLFYAMIYDATDGAFSLAHFFFCYLSVPLLILVAELTFMPAHPYHSLPELETKIEKAHDGTRDVHSSDDELPSPTERVRRQSIRAENRRSRLDMLEDLMGDEVEREERIKVEEERQDTSVVWGVLHGTPYHEQIMTPWFILILALTATQMIKMNNLIATIRSQYRFMLGSEEGAEEINAFFDVALPLGGIAATPLIGLLLTNVSVPTSFGVLTSMIIAIGFFNCLPYLWAGYITVIVFVIFRPFFYSAISDYSTKVFGFATFGRIYGTLTCISGLVNLSQSGLDALTHGPLGGNPIPLNIALGAVGALVGLVLTMFVAIRGHVFVQERQEMDADQVRQALLGGERNAYGTM